MILGKKEAFLYLHNKKDTQSIDYGEEGRDFEGHDICNIQVASNNKFFMLGVPAKRAIGFFDLNRT